MRQQTHRTSNRYETQKNGIKKNPAHNVPNILPAVQMLSNFHTTDQLFWREYICNFVIIGGIRPSKKLAGANKTTAIIREEYRTSSMTEVMNSKKISFVKNKSKKISDALK